MNGKKRGAPITNASVNNKIGNQQNQTQVPVLQPYCKKNIMLANSLTKKNPKI